MNQAEGIARNAAKWPESPALVAEGKTWSYRDLDLAIRCAATVLKENGITCGDVVALAPRDTPAHVICLFALGRIGAVVLPVDWRGRAEERERLVEMFSPKRVLVERPLAGFDPAISITVDEAWTDALAEIEPDPADPVDSTLPFLISLSSGTTAAARAMMLSHDQIQAWNDGYLAGYGIDERQRFLLVLPLSFTAGRNRVLIYLSAGGTLVLGPTLFSTEEVIDLVNGDDITVTILTPPLMRRVLEIAPDVGPLFPRLTMLEGGADKMSAEEKFEIVRKLSQNFYETYANSASGQVSCLRPGDLEEHAGSVGRPNPLLETEIVDAEGRPLPRGEVGALRIRGKATPTDYFTSENLANRSTDIRDGWYYPGDLGLIDEDGFLYLKGRTASVIIRGGLSIYPEEIEPILNAHPSVREAAIVGREGGKDGDDVVAFLVVETDLAETDLRSYLIDSLASYKHPQQFVFVEELPKTGTGKVNRGALKDMAAAGTPGG